MPDSSRRSEAIAALVLLALTCFAFRDLLGRGIGSSDAAVFAVAPLPGILILVVAAWYGWRRLRPAAGEVESRDGRPSSKPAATVLLLISVSLFIWARAVGESGLQFPALALLVVGVAALLGGAPLAWRLRAPAGLLLLGSSIPRPLEDEIVWALQRSTAVGANAALNAFGFEFKVAGVILRDGEHVFHVIDSCCGLTGTLILILIAVIVRELFGLAKLRSTLLLGATLVIGWVVNVLRVTYVASRPNPETLAGTGGDHTLQGVVVLAVGSAAVYAVGLMLESEEEGDPASDPPRKEFAAFDYLKQFSWPGTLAVGGLVLASLFVTPGALVPDDDPITRPIEFDPPAARWKSEDAPPLPYFHGRFVDQVHRRFVRTRDRDPLAFVDVFVGQGRAGGEFSTRLFSSKRFFPGPDWNVVSQERRMVWAVGSEIDTTLSAPNAQREHALLYVWTIGERGILVESLRSFLGLDRIRSASLLAEPVVVQLVAYSRSGQELRLDEAEMRLEQFLRDQADQFDLLPVGAGR